MTPALDPIIHEASRLKIIASLNEADRMDFMTLSAIAGLTRGNLSIHVAKLIDAGYVLEKKEFIDRKPHTEYRLTAAGRSSYRKYLADWKRVTGT